MSFKYFKSLKYLTNFGLSTSQSVLKNMPMQLALLFLMHFGVAWLVFCLIKRKEKRYFPCCFGISVYKFIRPRPNFVRLFMNPNPNVGNWRTLSSPLWTMGGGGQPSQENFEPDRKLLAPLRNSEKNIALAFFKAAWLQISYWVHFTFKVWN